MNTPPVYTGVTFKSVHKDPVIEFDHVVSPALVVTGFKLLYSLLKTSCCLNGKTHHEHQFLLLKILLHISPTKPYTFSDQTHSQVNGAGIHSSMCVVYDDQFMSFIRERCQKFQEGQINIDDQASFPNSV